MHKTQKFIAYMVRKHFFYVGGRGNGFGMTYFHVGKRNVESWYGGISEFACAYILVDICVRFPWLYEKQPPGSPVMAGWPGLASWMHVRLLAYVPGSWPGFPGHDPARSLDEESTAQRSRLHAPNSAGPHFYLSFLLLRCRNAIVVAPGSIRGSTTRAHAIHTNRPLRSLVSCLRLLLVYTGCVTGGWRHARVEIPRSLPFFSFPPSATN